MGVAFLLFAVLVAFEPSLLPGLRDAEMTPTDGVGSMIDDTGSMGALPAWTWFPRGA